MSDDRDGYVIKVDELPGSENASTFDGHRHGAHVSFFLSDSSPDQHPSGGSHGDGVAGVRASGRRATELPGLP